MNNNLVLNNLVGKFLNCRPSCPRDCGLIYKVTLKRIYYVSSGGEIRWITIDDFYNYRNPLNPQEGPWYFTTDNPIDTFWWAPEKIKERKSEFNLI